MNRDGLTTLGAAGALSIIATAVPARTQSDYTGPVDDRSKICMMQDSVQPREGLEYEHEGKSYWLCCSMCEAEFKKSPDTYARAVDPVSGAKVDEATAPIYAYQGYAFFFESAANLEKFAAASTQYARAGQRE